MTSKLVRTVLITGGCGFIGGAFARSALAKQQVEVINLDALTYAAQPQSLVPVNETSRYRFVKGDIADAGLVSGLLDEFQPDVLINFAAESHVDRSILGPAAFARTNIQGTLNLLECCRNWLELKGHKDFRFIQVSTDEVYGDLSADGLPAVEGDAWRPSSPYAASKAAADHLADAWHRTYGFPVMVSHASNNYGPWQYPEKLVPLVIKRALSNQVIPLYGNGEQVRDWLHVDDHVQALWCLLDQGLPGEHYNIGASQEIRNIALVEAICVLLDEFSPNTAPDGGHVTLVAHVDDRPGHDWRYALNTRKIEALGWKPRVTFIEGLRKTVRFYVDQISG